MKIIGNEFYVDFRPYICYYLCTGESEVRKMSPRTGRPTENPKKNRLEIRLTDTENNLLEKDSQKTNATKTELLMEGYAISQLITGEELKKRLIKEYYNLMEVNKEMQEMIDKMQNPDFLPMFKDSEKMADIEKYNEHIDKNKWLCKVIKTQLKREFGYEI